MADLVASVILALVVQSTILPPSLASTHWVVTEDGMITQQLDSVYSLRKPYDLVEFIRQAERSQMVHTLQQELLNQKIQIDEKDEKSDTNIEAKFYESDPDCMIAEKSLPEYDLYTSTVLPIENKGIKVEDQIDLEARLPKKLRQPNCSSLLDLPYSIHAFDHLKGVQDRSNLTNNPEPGLRSAIGYKDEPTEFGHLVYKSLQKNKTSWVLYNLAAFYWRIKGNSYQVIECCRRALHFSPRQHKDVALVNMANVLHRARHSADAAILVHASLDVSTDLNVNHFTLGNIYAVLGEYNKSVLCFEQTTEQQPDFEAARKRKHAVRCQEKLEVALEEQHEHLQRTLSELKDYQKKHEYFQDQRKIITDHEQATEVQFELNIKYQQQRLRDGVGETQKCHINDDTGRQVLVCKKEIQAESEAYGTIVTEKELQASDENDWKLELLKREEETVEVEVEEEEVKPEEPEEETEPSEPPVREPDPNAEYRTKEWPQKTDCDMNYKGLPIWKEYESTYLPPENKGFEVKRLLTEDLGLVPGPGEEHPLPWYPPVCVHTDDLTGIKTSVDKVDGIAHRTRIPIKMPDHNVKKILLKLVNDGDVTEEEVGQRLLTGLKNDLPHKWLHYTVAGLYWRVIGNNYHGVECLRRAVHFAPERYLDVPLVNLANIMQRVGNHKDAGILLKRALAVNDTEAVTHFTYGNVLASKGNYSGAAHEYIRALDLDPDLEPALKTLHTLRCHEKYHCAAKSNDDESSDSAMCQRPERSSSATSSSSSQTERRVVCHHVQGVEQCQLETRQRKVVSADDGSCSSICQTTCGGPPSREMCGDPNGKSGPRKCQVCSQCEENKAFQCHSPAPQQCISDALEIIEIGEDDLTDLENLEESLELFAPVAKALSEEQHVVNLKSSDTEGKKMVTVNLKTSSTTKTKQTSTTNGNNSNHNKNQSKDLNKNRNNGGGSKSETNTPTLTGPQIPGTHELETTVAMLIETAEYPWPSLEECKDIKKVNLKSFTSTWLSVTAKDINLRDHINFDDDIEEIILEPYCEATIGPSLFTLDHLKGLAERDEIEYSAEQGLKEVLETLGGDFESYHYIGTRINIAISFNQTSWVLANMAALYWRVEGEAEKALECLRQGLFFSPRPVKDVALISMANIFHRAGLYEDALVVTAMAMEISPNLVVIHFTMANIYSAMENYVEAIRYYEATLKLQPEFQPAVERINTIQCQLLQQRNSKK
ncbi:tetratricopeptide repeat protein 17-like [Ptychodera flava]|uniref:tetratricopeptide repeat protein 17-like n=1 Tax=Ptychodera flava TaxID=63121 RepID=UPI003969EB9C